MVSLFVIANLISRFELNISTILSGCLIAIAIVLIVVLQIARSKTKKTIPQMTTDIHRLGEVRQDKKQAAIAQQSVTVKLFEEKELGAENDNTTMQKQPATVQLYDEGKRNKKKNFSPELPTTLQIYEDEKPEGIYSVGNAQHIGKRDEQQDSFGISDIYNAQEVQEKGILAVLADGMGGLKNGAQSSRKVISMMLDAFVNNKLCENFADGLQSIVQNVNDAIYMEFNHENEENMTGSTVVAAFIKEDQFFWISVGDSRVYLFRNSQLTQLNREHNYGTRLDEEARNGYISAADAENDPNRAALTSYIGIDELNEIDRNLEPLQLQVGDRIVLCSDGVFSTITEDEMSAVLARQPQKAAQEMVERIVLKERRYQDNITVIVLGYRVS